MTLDAELGPRGSVSFAAWTAPGGILLHGRASGRGARVGASMRATTMGVLDGVSLLQMRSGVKRKAPDGCRGWWETEGGDASRVVSATVVMHSYWTLTRRLEVMSRTANAARILRSRTPARLSLNDTILKRLA